MRVVLSADSVTVSGDTIHYTQWDSIRVIGVGHDRGYSWKNTKSMSLELCSDTTVTPYLMLYHNQVDTLFIQHTPRVEFVSMACGCMMYHTIEQAWSTDPRVDSVVVLNAAVESFVQDNLCIYLNE